MPESSSEDLTKSPVSLLDKSILAVMNDSTVPLSANELQERLEVKGINYTRQYIKRRLNLMVSLHIVEIIGKRNKTELFRIVGQEMEPWEATSLNTDDPLIEMSGYYYSPDRLALTIRNSNWPMLSDKHERELKSLLQLMILGSSAYEVLKAHSILPVAHVRKTVEDLNARLKVMGKVIDTILAHDRIRDGSTGKSISGPTKDLILADLEEFITNFSVNVRSDINEDR